MRKKAFIDLKCALDFALENVLSQLEDGELHPITFHPQKFIVTEINYDAHGKERLVIVDSF